MISLHRTYNYRCIFPFTLALNSTQCYLLAYSKLLVLLSDAKSVYINKYNEYVLSFVLPSLLRTIL